VALFIAQFSSKTAFDALWLYFFKKMLHRHTLFSYTFVHLMY